MDLFAPDPAKPGTPDASAPLAERMRPRTLSEVRGQEDILGPNAPLRVMLEKPSTLRSVIFWGPPGSGKTTLAQLLANQAELRFAPVSAVTGSIKEARQIMDEARAYHRSNRSRTVLFVDEIHRFNKSQQDAFLPFVEEGSIVLVGATTENPSFSLVSALLSRCRIYVLKGLDEDALVALLAEAATDKERGLGMSLEDVPPEVLRKIASTSDGDARRALNLLELIAETAPEGVPAFSDENLTTAIRREHLLYDKSGDEHFNAISALHKSMRSSDVQGALYWCARMLISGEEPLYVARRLVRFASEDVGNADPQALTVTIAAMQTYQFLGSPEGELALYQAVAYLATAPKSNAVYAAANALKREISQSGSLPVPLHIRNAPTGLMKDLGYGKDYKYDHDYEGGFSGQTGLPDELRDRVFYQPADVGFEREIKKRMDWWERKRAEVRGASDEQPK